MKNINSVLWGISIISMLICSYYQNNIISNQNETINLLCKQNTVSLVLQTEIQDITRTRLVVYMIESDSKYDAFRKG